MMLIMADASAQCSRLIKALCSVILASGLLYRSQVTRRLWSPLPLLCHLEGGILHSDERNTRDHYVSHSSCWLPSFHPVGALEVQALIMQL